MSGNVCSIRIGVEFSVMEKHVNNIHPGITTVSAVSLLRASFLTCQKCSQHNFYHE